MNSRITISVDELLRERHPRLERLLPRSIKDRLERALCIDRINGYIIRNHNRTTIDFLGRFLRSMGVSYSINGVENLQVNGRYTIVANYPLGGLDGILLSWIILSRMGSVRVVVDDLLMAVRPLQHLWLPISRKGRQSAAVVQRMSEALRSDTPIITFPAGYCSQHRRGEVVDSAWHPKFIRRAMDHNREVVPVYIDGRLSNRFYRVARLRRMTGLKTRFEMYMLPAEMYRSQGSKISVHIGAPVSVSEMACAGSVFEACEMVRQRVYSMRENIKNYAI